MKKDRNELIRELELNEEKQLELKDKLLNLPKGHVNTLYRNNKGYYYLTYRDGKKIRNDYLGVVGKEDLHEIFEKLTEREKIKREIRSLKLQEKELKKNIGRRRKKKDEKSS
jgi:RecJ-like exonuclease